MSRKLAEFSKQGDEKAAAVATAAAAAAAAGASDSDPAAAAEGVAGGGDETGKPTTGGFEQDFADREEAGTLSQSTRTTQLRA